MRSGPKKVVIGDDDPPRTEANDEVDPGNLVNGDRHGTFQAAQLRGVSPVFVATLSQEAAEIGRRLGEEDNDVGAPIRLVYPAYVENEALPT